MMTKRFLIVFPAVFAIVSTLIFCNSVVYAGGATKPTMESKQKIQLSARDKDVFVSVYLRDVDQCPTEVKKSNPSIQDMDRYPDFYQKLGNASTVNYIFALPCNCLIADVVGNTTCYCTPTRCYCY